MTKNQIKKLILGRALNFSLVRHKKNSTLTRLLWSVADDILVKDAHQCISVQSNSVFSYHFVVHLVVYLKACAKYSKPKPKLNIIAIIKIIIALLKPKL